MSNTTIFQTPSLALSTFGASAPVTLLQDDFFSDPPGPVSPTTWSYPTGAAEYIPSTLGPEFPGTETAPSLPVVE
jgi:hypothetical protein